MFREGAAELAYCLGTFQASNAGLCELLAMSFPHMLETDNLTSLARAQAIAPADVDCQSLPRSGRDTRSR